MTDGVTDVFNNGCVDQHCTAALDPTLCTAFKSANISVGVIYTTYVPVASPFYTQEVAPVASQIQPNMQACATSGYYFQATDGPAIETAANQLFAAVAESERLTN
jgi:hypothetical protein